MKALIKMSAKDFFKKYYKSKKSAKRLIGCGYQTVHQYASKGFNIEYSEEKQQLKIFNNDKLINIWENASLDHEWLKQLQNEKQGLYKCGDCKEYYSGDMFYKNPRTRTGFQFVCKECSHENNKQRSDGSTTVKINTKEKKCSDCGVTRPVIFLFRGKCSTCSEKKTTPKTVVLAKPEESEQDLLIRHRHKLTKLIKNPTCKYRHENQWQPIPRWSEKNRKESPVKIKGKVYNSMKEASQKLSVSYDTVYSRVRRTTFPQWQRL